MSRIGLKPMTVPAGVTVTVEDRVVTVKGPRGTLSQQIGKGFEVEQEDTTLSLKRPNELKETKSLHGLYRSLIANMIEGVTQGFSKTLLIEGTGYRASKQNKDLVMNLGYSHQVKMTDPEGIEVTVPTDRTIVVTGNDKQQVGNYAANIRKWRLPEPYKGKGIRYEGEHIRRKVGKTGK